MHAGPVQDSVLEFVHVRAACLRSVKLKASYTSSLRAVQDSELEFVHVLESCTCVPPACPSLRSVKLKASYTSSLRAHAVVASGRMQ
jgi:hypothetical protein